jgi:hypothetical protein
VAIEVVDHRRVELHLARLATLLLGAQARERLDRRIARRQRRIGGDDARPFEGLEILLAQSVVA